MPTINEARAQVALPLIATRLERIINILDRLAPPKLDTHRALDHDKLELTMSILLPALDVETRRRVVAVLASDIIDQLTDHA